MPVLLVVEVGKMHQQQRRLVLLQDPDSHLRLHLIAVRHVDLVEKVQRMKRGRREVDGIAAGGEFGGVVIDACSSGHRPAHRCGRQPSLVGCLVERLSREWPLHPDSGGLARCEEDRRS